MYSKHTKRNECGNCHHEIQYNEIECRHQYWSYLCLETNCQCLDPTGRDTTQVGMRKPFNKIWNQDMLKGVIAAW